MYISPFLDEIPRALKRLIPDEKPVLHHQTCPVCGRQRVNLYDRGRDWKCKKCWDAFTQEKEGTGR